MPTPPNPLRRVVDAATRGPETLLRVADAVPRVGALLDAAEKAMTRVEHLLTRLERTEDKVEELTAGALETGRRAEDLVRRYEPALRDIAGTVERASTRIGPQQVDDLVACLTFLPILRDIDQAVVPVMRTLDTVAPDLTELLAVSRALNELMGALPGLGRTKKRVDEQLAQEHSREEGPGD